MKVSDAETLHILKQLRLAQNSRSRLSCEHLVPMERHSPERDGSKPQSPKLETPVSKVRIVSVERGSDCRC